MTLVLGFLDELFGDLIARILFDLEKGVQSGLELVAHANLQSRGQDALHACHLALQISPLNGQIFFTASSDLSI